MALRGLAAVERGAGGSAPSADEAVTLLAAPASLMPDLLSAAAAVRDRGRGRRMTFSAKVFVPLTNLCRDYCGYCIFRRDPRDPGALTITPGLAWGRRPVSLTTSAEIARR